MLFLKINIRKNYFSIFAQSWTNVGSPGLELAGK